MPIRPPAWSVSNRGEHLRKEAIMAYPVAAGVTGHSGIYTPEIYSGKTLVKFYKTTVLGDISNTDYEG